MNVSDMLKIINTLGFDQLNFELEPLGYHGVPCSNVLGFKLERLEAIHADSAE